MPKAIVNRVDYVWNTMERHGTDAEFCRRAYFITKVPGVDVAYLPITFSVSAEEQRQRAKLYAAAPELLAALKSLLAAAKCGYDPVVALNEYGEAAEAAIRKAEEGQP